ncbi:MAG: LptF/LptG family permease, partial [Bacteroidales bacterium]
MKKLYKLTLKSFLGPFFLTFFIVVFVLLMQFLWKYIDDLVGKGLEIHVITELLMYTSASLVPMALPLAVLLASIMTYGNLAEYNELLALKSAGIPLQKIMAPVMVLTIFITFSAFLFNNNVLP